MLFDVDESLFCIMNMGVFCCVESVVGGDVFCCSCCRIGGGGICLFFINSNISLFNSLCLSLNWNFKVCVCIVLCVLYCIVCVVLCLKGLILDFVLLLLY